MPQPHRLIAVAALSALTLFAAAAEPGAKGDPYGPLDGLAIAKPDDAQHHPSTPAPEGAVVLFGGGFDLKANWQRKGGGEPGWELKDGGVMQVKGGDLVSKQTFNEPIHLHVEFRVPYMPTAKGQVRGNSGVYVQGRYEVQVLDSYGIPYEKYQQNDCGSIYSVAKATENACKAPTVWQAYDIEFTPPKFDADGKKTANPRITVQLNGKKIHDNVEITKDNTPSGAGGDVKQPGPVLLQDHGNPVQYRNIWVKKLEQK